MSSLTGTTTRIRGKPVPAAAPPSSSLRSRRGRPLGELTFSAVIPTKDRATRAQAAVAGLLVQTRRPERIVVVDASEPPLTLPAQLREAARVADVELVLITGQPSTSGQRNRGVERVRTPLVLLLDDDVTLRLDYAQVLLERWEHDGLAAYGALVGAPLNVPHQRWLPRLLRRASMLHYQARRAPATTFRRSRKLRLVSVPAGEVVVPACGAGYGLFRTDLLRRHPFDERFSGYVQGEDLDMSSRLSADAPILQVPSARWAHDFSPHERVSAARWRQRGRTETYFRARHLERSPLSLAAFALSLLAETGVATAYSLRHRGGHVFGYVAGVREMLHESDLGYASGPEPVGAGSSAASEVSSAD